MIIREITVKGGKSFEILLSSIEPEFQEKYYSKIVPTYEVKRLLKTNPQMIIVDEIDYLLKDFRTIEILRDLHDKTGVPKF